MDAKGITKTKNQCLILIKSILNKAVENDIIQKNVALGIKLKSHKSKEKNVISNSIIDFFAKNVQKSQKYDYFFILFAIYTGLRRGELTAVTKNDIDLRNKIITINKSATFIHNQAIIKSTKNEETRYVPIFDILYTPLKQYMDLIDTEYLFTKQDGTIMSEICIRRKLEHINNELNTYMNEKNHDNKDYSITLHQTRHTFCSILHNAGIDVKQAQAWTGHKDIRVLLDIYTHLDKKQSKNSINKVNEYLS